MRFMFRRSWYQVEQLVQGGAYRPAYRGTIGECHRYVDKVMDEGEALRVVKVKLVMERDGVVADDFERDRFRTEALRDVAEVLSGHFPETWPATW